jgi:hypothetical protein
MKGLIYKADFEILNYVKLDIILEELLMEDIVRLQDIKSYKLKLALSPDEIKNIQKFLNKNGSK